MKIKKTAKTTDTLERERERESKSLKKIDFICSAKNKKENELKRNKNNRIKVKKNIKKRMGYEFKKLVCKIKIAKTSLKNHILSFLCVCEICTNRRMGEKDKYAWEVLVNFK